MQYQDAQTASLSDRHVRDDNYAIHQLAGIVINRVHWRVALNTRYKVIF